MLLPRYHVYAYLMRDGHATGWISAKTIAAPAPTSDPVEFKNHSAELYGRDAAEVELATLRAVGLEPTGNEVVEDEPIGQRKRSPQ